MTAANPATPTSIPIYVRLVPYDQWLRIKVDPATHIATLKDVILEKARIGGAHDDETDAGPSTDSSRNARKALSTAILPADLPKAYLARKPRRFDALQSTGNDEIGGNVDTARLPFVGVGVQEAAPAIDQPSRSPRRRSSASHVNPDTSSLQPSLPLRPSLSNSTSSPHMTSVSLGSAGSSIAGGSGRATQSVDTEARSPRGHLLHLGRNAIGSLSPKKSLRNLRGSQASNLNSSQDGSYPGALGLTGNEDALRKEQEVRLRLERAVKAHQQQRAGDSDSTGRQGSNISTEATSSPSSSAVPLDVPERQRLLNSANARRARRQRSRALDFLEGGQNSNTEGNSASTQDSEEQTPPSLDEDAAGMLRVTHITGSDSLLDSSSESENHQDHEWQLGSSLEAGDFSGTSLPEVKREDHLITPTVANRDRSGTITAGSRPATASTSQRAPQADVTFQQQSSSSSTVAPAQAPPPPRLGGVHRNEISAFMHSHHPLASQYVLYTLSNGLLLEDFATVAGSKIRPYELIELQAYSAEERVRLPRRSEARGGHAIFDQAYVRPYAHASAYVYKPNSSPRSAERAGLGQWKLRWLMVYDGTLSMYRKRPSRVEIAQAMAASQAQERLAQQQHVSGTSSSNNSLNAAAAAAAASGALTLPLVTWDLDKVRCVGAEKADGGTNPPSPAGMAQDCLTVAFSAPAISTAPSLLLPQGSTGAVAAGGYGTLGTGSGIDHTISLRFTTDHQAYAWHRVFQRAHMCGVAAEAIAVAEEGGLEKGMSYLPAREVQRAMRCVDEANKIGEMRSGTKNTAAPMSRRMAEQADQVQRATSRSLHSTSSSSSPTTPTLLAIDPDRWRQLALHRAFISGRGGVVPPGKAGRHAGRNALARARLRPEGSDDRLEDADDWSSEEEAEDFLAVVGEAKRNQDEGRESKGKEKDRSEAARPSSQGRARPQSTSAAPQQQCQQQAGKQERRASQQGASAVGVGKPRRQPSSPDLRASAKNRSSVGPGTTVASSNTVAAAATPTSSSGATMPQATAAGSTRKNRAFSVGSARLGKGRAGV